MTAFDRTIGMIAVHRGLECQVRREERVNAGQASRRPHLRMFIACAGPMQEVVMERLKQAFRRNGEPGKQKGAMGYVLAWLLGVPIPILIIVALLRGCS
ncbi:MAG TPA: hypothetical protein VJ727_09580 [Rhodanobacteraceae bacterium]|nr:hypothetical protein [Rhodanobacteraceae bacterium]